jgi:hypothetical protein
VVVTLKTCKDPFEEEFEEEGWRARRVLPRMRIWEISDEDEEG